MVGQAHISTPDGKFVVGFSAAGLCALRFPGGSVENSSATIRDGGVPSDWLTLTTQAVIDVLTGCGARQLPPLDLSAGTAFQQLVWRALLQIPPGETRSYAEIATAIGRPRAVRAVGGACGANPVPLIVPCHRVTAAHQQLGGFSCGRDWKIRLLQREGSLPRTLW